MTLAFRLVAKALSLQVPPRALIWGLMNKLNYVFRTGNRRFEFERLYLESPDPWDYHSSTYERDKYEHILDCVLKWRGASESVLEIGCSVGVFSQLIARQFNKATAIDISKEALRAAADHNRAETNIRFLHDDLRSLNLSDQYDVIVCADVLYYIREKDAQRVCRQLDRYLAPNGVIVMVTGISNGNQHDKPNFFYFDGWEEILASHFEWIFRETVQDSLRPYQIVVFSRRD
jgi:2-polyprenyl-3-methyl-5-hydroxy-6-metoxy-1,4-benzoquinol methylase